MTKISAFVTIIQNIVIMKKIKKNNKIIEVLTSSEVENKFEVTKRQLNYWDDAKLVN